ncbi:NAD(P)H-hydrate dehydratase [Fructobacillus sp. M1-13]|uniref:ADP-dependent (S)-NAD(P)H-hydrate dehydratase n=1 Tax=Fructobacillus papyriferae TaxID=2713171 RepID=A0ABS5QPZ9_9LACO|nr:NAD(P)H-hydrate dehydratase [Fructobacillus papyriferae]MBS9334471.1 NAD(P)H-hydrate dehydratase [Fructobacillus papyriferae]MCD2158460.1 NAD(P)H-hydrate dehydratase [Fructobacillus papyriferae]
MKKISKTIAASVVRPRPAHSHKGNYGRVLIIAGNHQFGGAAIMNAQAAVQSGAGLVTVATDLTNKTAIHARLPEAMVVNYRDNLAAYVKKADVILIGSGLGDERDVLETCFSAISSEQTLIVDGSALSMMAAFDLALPDASQLVLTPHQMEWQRLSGVAIAEQVNQETNQAALQRLAPTESNTSANNKTPALVLKSEATQVYLKDDVYQLTVGGPYQATGGMGDTLAGMIAGFAAQFAPTSSAVLAAVYCHSAIAEELSQKAYVTLPSKIAEKIPAYMKKLSEE